MGAGRVALGVEDAALVADAVRPVRWRVGERVEPLLLRDSEGVLESTFLFEQLAERYPGRFGAGQVRTLQRRVREWRALQGPAREVFFPQVHPPGREAQLDFTHAGELGVTIGGEPLAHLLFELVLCASG